MGYPELGQAVKLEGNSTRSSVATLSPNLGSPGTATLDTSLGLSFPIHKMEILWPLKLGLLVG